MAHLAREPRPYLPLAEVAAVATRCHTGVQRRLAGEPDSDDEPARRVPDAVFAAPEIVHARGRAFARSPALLPRHLPPQEPVRAAAHATTPGRVTPRVHAWARASAASAARSSAPAPARKAEAFARSSSPRRMMSCSASAARDQVLAACIQHAAAES